MSKTLKTRARSTSGSLIHINVQGEGKDKLGATGFVIDMGKGNNMQRESYMAESTRSSHEEVSKMEDGDERKVETNSHLGVELFGGRN